MHPAVRCVAILVSLVVGAGGASAQPAQAPGGLTASVARYVVTFRWQPPLTPAAPVDGYVLEAGTSPGTTIATLPLGAGTSFTVAAPDGVFFVRVRAQSAAGLSDASNEVRVVTGQGGPPDPPVALLANASGGAVAVQWTENPLGAVIAGYQLEVGSAPGLTDIAHLMLPPTPTALTGVVPAGTYHLRLRAFNAGGASLPSNQAVVTVSAAACEPAPPTGLSATPFPGAVALSWTQPNGPAPSGYRLDAGTSSGATNVGSFALSAATSVSTPAPPGTYFVRVVALNQCGASAPSAQISFTVPVLTAPSLVGTWDGLVFNHPGSFGRGPITSFVLTVTREPTRNNVSAGGSWRDNLGCQITRVVPFLTAGGQAIVSMESLPCNDGDFTLTVTGGAGNVVTGTCRGNCTFRMTKR